jgi:site-specific recombinase XerD
LLNQKPSDLGIGDLSEKQSQNFRDLVSHAGRHFFLTSLAEKGVSVHVLAALAGHRNISTTMVYLHANATVLRAAVELV